LRVDRQELPQVGDEAPVRAGFGLASFPARCKLDRLQAKEQRAIPQQLPRPSRPERRDRLGDRAGRQKDALPGEPETGFRRRFVAGLWKLLPIDSQL